jgi:predicted transcriptional regulator
MQTEKRETKPDVAPDESTDLRVRERLETLGVSLLSEWDVLAFLHRHQTSLTSAAQIARLLGDDKATVSVALDRLESLGLVQRSRGSQGIRLYRISVPTDPSHYSCFMELMSLAEGRTGRLLLLKLLPRRRLRPSIRARGLRIR